MTLHAVHDQAVSDKRETQYRLLKRIMLALTLPVVPAAFVGFILLAVGNRGFVGDVLVALGVGYANPGLPHSGDTVAPRLIREVKWTPGKKVYLWVELAAFDRYGREPRRLSFDASRKENPVALVDFRDVDGKPLKSFEVELSHRC